MMMVLTASIGASAQAVVGEMFASDASVRGSVLFASGGTQIQSGSSVSAGDAAAVLKLARGGEVRVCPKTTVSVSSSSNGRDLLWGMNDGALEAHFQLATSADTFITPDFRILLAGPGTFHFAISSNSRGDACVRALASNTSSLIVNELYGDGTYQVKPNEQVIFHGGKLANADGLVPPDCGCPPPPIPVEHAQMNTSTLAAAGGQVAAKPVPVPVLTKLGPSRFELANLGETSILPPPDDVPVSEPHLQMEAPFVYSPADPEQEMVMAVARLRLTSGSNFAQAEVQPPIEKPSEPTKVMVAAPVQTAKKKGFFGKIGSFFSAVFR
jgi:hypothetical protein